MIYVCEKCTKVFVSDNTPESCPRCKSAEFRRATDREVIDYIGSIFLASLDNGKEMGGKIISLGKRILRTETAAICAVSMCMLAAELNEIG